MEFKDYVRMVLAHWVGVVVLIALGVLAAVAYNQNQPAVYQASATGLITAGKSADTTDASVNESLARSKVVSYAAIATSSSTAQQVVTNANLPVPVHPEFKDVNPGSLISKISVSQPTDTVLIKIAARGPTPEAAQALADAWAQALAIQIEHVEHPNASEEMLQSGTLKGMHMEVYASAQPGAKVLPRTQVNLVVGLVLGMLLGFVYALIRKQFDRRLRNSEDVQKKFGIPVIGLIPQSSQVRQADGRQLFLAVTGAAASSSASTAEAFRKLRTNLAYMDVDHPPRVIVVTSPKQSDGKSTVAANLAAAIAIGGQPVTLIDGDLRRPTVADSLALVDGAGLTDVLVGRVKAEQVMQDHPDVPGLRVMASGAIPPNPSELLGSHVMASLIAELAKDAMVIIDAPPLLPVTDAAVLTRSADGAIVVITHGGTLDSELQASLNHISTVHGRTLGIVFNRMRRRASGGYYGGDYYRYEYKSNEGRRKSKNGKSGRTEAAKPATTSKGRRAKSLESANPMDVRGPVDPSPELS
jgi:capsular exopolysaccharide synthesis family protein